jgi:DNA-binding MarR family transcriptional regulator
MSIDPESELVTNFLGSSHIFAFAVGHVIEEQLWREATGNQYSVQQLKLLKLVDIAGSHTISDVSAFLGVSNAAASKAVDKLAKMMLLRRSEGETDRRSIHLSLTGVGRRVLAAFETGIKQRVAEMLGDYAPEDLQRLIEMLDRLSARLVDHHARPDEICVQCGIYFVDKCLKREHLGRECLYTRQRERSQARTTSPSPETDPETDL